MTAKHKSMALAAAVAVVGAAAATTLTTGAAEAASLPSISKSKKAGGGSVTIRLYDQKYSVQKSVANNPFSREVFASGKVKVTTAGDIEGAIVTPGYLVGCQLNFGADAGTEIIATSNEEDQFSTEITVPTGGGATDTIPIPTPFDEDSGGHIGFTLSPGEAKFAPVISVKVGDDVTNSFTFTKGVGGVTYSKERFGVDGCAGFAQARALVNVQVSTDTFKGNVTLYGKPFSIG